MAHKGVGGLVLAAAGAGKHSEASALVVRDGNAGHGPHRRAGLGLNADQKWHLRI